MLQYESTSGVNILHSKLEYVLWCYETLICLCLLQVGLHSLNLGICPKLNSLHIEAARMVLLELKGCGVLSEASINCPLLTSLDASFCR